MFSSPIKPPPPATPTNTDKPIKQIPKTALSKPKKQEQDIPQQRLISRLKLQSSWQSIIDKYSSVNLDDDIIDLRTGEVVIDYGRLSETPKKPFGGESENECTTGKRKRRDKKTSPFKKVFGVEEEVLSEEEEIFANPIWNKHDLLKHTPRKHIEEDPDTDFITGITGYPTNHLIRSHIKASTNKKHTLTPLNERSISRSYTNSPVLVATPKEGKRKSNPFKRKSEEELDGGVDKVFVVNHLKSRNLVATPKDKPSPYNRKGEGELDEYVGKILVVDRNKFTREKVIENDNDEDDIWSI